MNHVGNVLRQDIQLPNSHQWILETQMNLGWIPSFFTLEKCSFLVILVQEHRELRNQSSSCLGELKFLEDKGSFPQEKIIASTQGILNFFFPMPNRRDSRLASNGGTFLSSCFCHVSILYYASFFKSNIFFKKGHFIECSLAIPVIIIKSISGPETPF